MDAKEVELFEHFDEKTRDVLQPLHASLYPGTVDDLVSSLLYKFQDFELFDEVNLSHLLLSLLLLALKGLVIGLS